MIKDGVSMPDNKDYSGVAALSICEALMLALNDHKVLPEREIVGILHDAAATHENAGVLDGNEDLHRGAALLIKGIIAGGNSVRRP